MYGVRRGRAGSYRQALLLSIVGLGAALIADYTLTTALVYLSKPYGKG